MPTTRPLSSVRDLARDIERAYRSAMRKERAYHCDPEILGGTLVFKGTRVPVQTFFDHLDRGGTVEQFLEWYDGVTREQLEAALEIRTVTA